MSNKDFLGKRIKIYLQNSSTVEGIIQSVNEQERTISVQMVEGGSILLIRGQDVRDLELIAAVASSSNGGVGSNLLHHLLPGLSLSNTLPNNTYNTYNDLPDPPVLTTNPTSFVAHIEGKKEEEGDEGGNDGGIEVIRSRRRSISNNKKK